MDIVFFISFSLLMLYSIFIIFLSLKWTKEPLFKNVEVHPVSFKTSIVIAARNEFKTIENCLSDLVNQNYPKDLYEIIVVDDFSDDNTADKVQSVAENYPELVRLQCLSSLNNGNFGKKYAISKGIEKAQGDFIITTDADCRFGSDWLVTVVNFYRTHHFKMILGPVAFMEQEGVFKKMQQIEFAALMGVSASMSFLKNPIMCNAANLAFEKSLYCKYQNKIFNQYSSGDDMFFLLAVKAHENSTIGFVKSQDAMVYTYSKDTIKLFLEQRKRWASKAKSYRDLTTIVVSLLVLVSSLIILITLCLSLIDFSYLWISLLLIGLKTMADFIFLFKLAPFFNIKKYFWVFIPQQFCYLFYILIMALSSIQHKYYWKNRVVS